MLAMLKLPNDEWNPDIPDPETQFIDVISRLKEHYKTTIQEPEPEHYERFKRFSTREEMLGWECFFVPEENFYKSILFFVSQDDVVFDVGAGDLRLDLMLSERTKRVYAIEINPEIIGPALDIIGMDKPRNLIAICGNAFDMDLPHDVTIIICLMIHREHDFPASWKGKRVLFCKRGIGAPILSIIH